MLTVSNVQAYLKDKPGAHTLDDLWEDAVTRKLLQDIARYTRRKGGKDKKSTKSKSARALIDLKALRSIDPPPAQTLYRWLNDSASFPAIENSADVRPKSLQHAYDVTITLEDNNLSSIVALRFFHLLFFDIGKHLEPTKTRVNYSLAAGVAGRLTTMGVDNVDLDRLKRWIIVGSIYNDLIKVFGEGCLFFLPAEIGFRRWLLLGSKTPEVITHLDAIGIRNWIEKFKPDDMGQTIRQSLLSPVVNSFQTSVNQVHGLHASISGCASDDTCRMLPSSAEGQLIGMIRHSEQRDLVDITQSSVNMANFAPHDQLQLGLPSAEISGEASDWIAVSDFPFLDFTPVSNFNFMSAPFAEML